MNELNKIDSSFSRLNENKFIDFILSDSDKFDKLFIKWKGYDSQFRIDKKRYRYIK